LAFYIEAGDLVERVLIQCMAQCRAIIEFQRSCHPVRGDGQDVAENQKTQTNSSKYNSKNRGTPMTENQSSDAREKNAEYPLKK
jgi:hypothetical protein